MKKIREIFSKNVIIHDFFASKISVKIPPKKTLHIGAVQDIKYQFFPPKKCNFLPNFAAPTLNIRLFPKQSRIESLSP